MHCREILDPLDPLDLLDQVLLAPSHLSFTLVLVMTWLKCRFLPTLIMKVLHLLNVYMKFQPRIADYVHLLA